MPLNVSSAASPNSASAYSTTSASPVERNDTPRFCSVSADLPEVVQLAVEHERGRPSRVSIGWLPASDRSRIDSRRKPSRQQAPSVQSPAASGPRRAIRLRRALDLATPARDAAGEREHAHDAAHVSASRRLEPR